MSIRTFRFPLVLVFGLIMTGCTSYTPPPQATLAKYEAAAAKCNLAFPIINGTVRPPKEGSGYVRIDAQPEQPVRALRAGFVHDLPTNFNQYGSNRAIILHAENSSAVFDEYVGLNAKIIVKEGDFVKAGQTIGFVQRGGDAMNNPGSHVRIGMTGPDKKTIDPRPTVQKAKHCEEDELDLPRTFFPENFPSDWKKPSWY